MCIDPPGVDHWLCHPTEFLSAFDHVLNPQIAQLAQSDETFTVPAKTGPPQSQSPCVWITCEPLSSISVCSDVRATPQTDNLVIKVADFLFLLMVQSPHPVTLTAKEISSLAASSGTVLAAPRMSPGWMGRIRRI